LLGWVVYVTVVGWGGGVGLAGLNGPALFPPCRAWPPGVLGW
jgi:hypothetical protein